MGKIEEALMLIYIEYLRYVRSRLLRAKENEMIIDLKPEMIIDYGEFCRINMNLMAEIVAHRDGGREESSISQVKELLKIFLEELSIYQGREILELVNRYKK